MGCLALVRSKSTGGEPPRVPKGHPLLSNTLILGMEWNEIPHDTTVLLRNQRHKQSLCSYPVMECTSHYCFTMQHYLLLYFKADDVIVSGG